MSLDDSDRHTPWTRDQLWSENDARVQRRQGRLLISIVAATWFAGTMASYPWSLSTSPEPPAPSPSQPGHGILCQVDQDCRPWNIPLQMWRHGSPSAACRTYAICRGGSCRVVDNHRCTSDHSLVMRDAP